jgi:hypothetical protein
MKSVMKRYKIGPVPLEYDTATGLSWDEVNLPSVRRLVEQQRQEVFHTGSQDSGLPSGFPIAWEQLVRQIAREEIARSGAEVLATGCNETR